MEFKKIVGVFFVLALTLVGSPSLVGAQMTTQLPAACPLLGVLTLGSSGQQVVGLQTYLQSTGDFTYPVITGYYGNITMAAVQKWQARNGVVSSGSISTTGFGRFGPKSVALYLQLCGSGSNPGQSFTVSPVQGTAPLVVSATVVTPPLQVTVCGPYVVGSINWGDGTAENVTFLGCSSESRTVLSHTYSSAGLFSPTFTTTQGSLLRAGPISVALTSNTSYSLQASSPSVARVVTFTGYSSSQTGYTLDFGDPAISPSLNVDPLSSQSVSGNQIGNFSHSHRYSAPGTYTAKLYAQCAANAKCIAMTLVAQATITIY